jgi:uncharacterized membrane protein YozB (DUF420 family)
MNYRSPIAGILPWRAPFMIDVIALAMVFVLAALSWSLFSVKHRKQYHRHKRIQLSLASSLLVLLVFFEVDIQYFENWRERAALSPFYHRATGTGLVMYSLWVHLFFATTTLALWFTIIFKALNQFPNPPRPTRHSDFHARWGRLAAIDMVLTAVTGWTFYYLAFVA